VHLLKKDGARLVWPHHRGKRRVIAAIAVALPLALFALGACGMARARAAMDSTPLTRAAVTTCAHEGDSSLVYRVTLLRHGGVVCTALVHRTAFYSNMLGVMIPEQWLRIDCELNTPRDLPYCADRVLAGPGDWLALAAPPASDVLALAPGGGR